MLICPTGKTTSHGAAARRIHDVHMYPATVCVAEGRLFCQDEGSKNCLANATLFKR